MTGRRQVSRAAAVRVATTEISRVGIRTDQTDAFPDTCAGTDTATLRALASGSKCGLLGKRLVGRIIGEPPAVSGLKVGAELPATAMHVVPGTRSKHA